MDKETIQLYRDKLNLALKICPSVDPKRAEYIFFRVILEYFVEHDVKCKEDLKGKVY